MTPPLEQVIADWRENAQVLRRTGHQHDGDLIDQLLDEVVSASEEFVTWLTEDDAMLRSGRARTWLRSRWPQWAAQGHAKHDERNRRLYRTVVVPQRVNLAAAREDARRTARRAAV